MEREQRRRLVVIAAIATVLFAIPALSMAWINHQLGREASRVRARAEGRQVNMGTALVSALGGGASAVARQAGVSVDGEGIAQRGSLYCIRWTVRYAFATEDIYFTVPGLTGLLTSVHKC